MDLQPIIERMRRNAGAIAALVEGTPPDLVRLRPAPDSWSPLDVICHLADEEVRDFRRRIELTLHHPGKEWPPIDPPAWVVEHHYAEQDPALMLAHFLKEREHSLAWLGVQAGADWNRAHEHPSLGTLRAGDLLASWVAHDLLHLRQLARLHHSAVTQLLPGCSSAYAGSW